MNSESKIGIYGVLYYILSIIAYIFLFIYSCFIDDVILSLQLPLLYFSLVIYIPFILLILPVIFKTCLKKNTIISLKISSIITIIYLLVIIPVIHFGVIFYAKSFTVDKWNDMRFLRYLMIDNLESKYDLVGMTEEKIYNLLGSSDKKDENNNICYFVKDDKEDYYFCLRFDDDIVIDTYKNY